MKINYYSDNHNKDLIMVDTASVKSKNSHVTSLLECSFPTVCTIQVVTWLDLSSLPVSCIQLGIRTIMPIFTPKFEKGLHERTSYFL